MGKSKEIATALGTLAIAVGIGFVMQSTETAKARYSFDVQDTVSAAVAAAPNFSFADGSSLNVKDVELTSALTGLSDIDKSLKLASISRGAPQSPSVFTSMSSPDCPIHVEAQPIIGGMVSLTINAGCLPDTKLSVHHNGIVFTEATNEEGALRVIVPALQEKAVFIIAFESGEGAVVQADVEGLRNYARTVLQWHGQSGLALHAREFGARDGRSSDLWHGSKQNLAGVADGVNGLVLRLGDNTLSDPMIADVYTYPAARSAKTGTIELQVKANVTEESCGRDFRASALEMAEGGAIFSRDLSLTMPGCEAVGQSIVLNNLVSNLKVARN
ncbi:MAG: hypothetical protein AAFV87_04235 [Pseudomonadota bacterium]